MDIADFEKRFRPRAKRSRLIPFAAAIFELKQKGYSDLQVSEWLAQNGLKITDEAVRQFIKSRSQEPGEGKTVSAKDKDQNQNPSESQQTQQNRQLTQAEKMQKILEDQKQDAASKVFRHDKTGKTS